jgi:hypothetical protein
MYNILDATGLICWVTANRAYAFRLAEYWGRCTGHKFTVVLQ